MTTVSFIAFFSDWLPRLTKYMKKEIKCVWTVASECGPIREIGLNAFDSHVVRFPVVS